MRSVVSVWTRWGDYVLGVQDVRPGQSLSVGLPPAPLVRFGGSEPRVFLAQPGEAPDERTLGVGETLTFGRDGLKYTVVREQLDAGPRPNTSGRRRALVAAGVLAVLGVAHGLLQSAPSVAPMYESATMGARGSADPEAAPPARTPVLVVAAEPQSHPLNLPGDMRCGLAEMGAYVADSRGRYGISGPLDNADPHLARPVLGVGHPKAHGIRADLGIARRLQGSAGPTADFARDTALGSDPASAHGRMWGDQWSDQLGEGGLGLAGEAGGIVKGIDVAPSTENISSVLRVLHTGLDVKGPRKASEVGRVMAAHFADFGRCATAGPGHARRVELDFEVARDGRASATTASATSLERCLERSLTSVVFSADASDVAHVVYPLYFVPATEGLHVERVVRRGPAIFRPFIAHSHFGIDLYL